MNVLLMGPLVVLKRGERVGKIKRGKGTKLMVLVDGKGTLVGIHMDSASPSEVKLLMPTLATVRIKTHQPQRLIADKGYDSNKIRKRLKARGIEPIIPARKNIRKATDQDERKLRRYRRRWIVEKTTAWLQNFRRWIVRYERSVTMYSVLVHMACALIASKKVLG